MDNKNLTWVQGEDFSSWWFENSKEKRVGPVVRERAFFEVVVEGEDYTFNTLPEAKDFVRSLVGG